MKTKHTWRKCVECDGARFTADNRLCPECSGDGCCLELLNVERTPEGMIKLVNDLSEDLFWRK